MAAGKVRIAEPRIKSASANLSPKLTTVVAGMCAGADCIDDLDIVRAGGMSPSSRGVYPPSTVGTLLREFTFGHARQLESVLREHPAGLCQRVDLLPGAHRRAFVDIDSLLRPVYGHAKQGASCGHTNIAGREILRTSHRDLLTTRRKARPENTGKPRQTSGYRLPTTRNAAKIGPEAPQRGRATDRGLTLAPPLCRRQHLN